MDVALNLSSFRPNFEDLKGFIINETTRNSVFTVAMLIFPFLGIIACTYVIRSYYLNKDSQLNDKITKTAIKSIDPNKKIKGEIDWGTAYKIGGILTGLGLFAGTAYCINSCNCFTAISGWLEKLKGMARFVDGEAENILHPQRGFPEGVPFYTCGTAIPRAPERMAEIFFSSVGRVTPNADENSPAMMDSSLPLTEVLSTVVNVQNAKIGILGLISSVGLYTIGKRCFA